MTPAEAITALQARYPGTETVTSGDSRALRDRFRLIEDPAQ